MAVARACGSNITTIRLLPHRGHRRRVDGTLAQRRQSVATVIGDSHWHTYLAVVVEKKSAVPEAGKAATSPGRLELSRTGRR
jgi:hypothetical protein